MSKHCSLTQYFADFHVLPKHDFIFDSIRNQQDFLYAKPVFCYWATLLAPNLIYFSFQKVHYTVKFVSLKIFPYVICGFIYFLFVEGESDYVSLGGLKF